MTTTIGEYRAIWMVVFMEQSRVEDMLRREMAAWRWRLLPLPHAAPDGDGTSTPLHPVLLELGREIDCGPALSSWLRSSFYEFKLEVPFVGLALGAANNNDGDDDDDAGAATTAIPHVCKLSVLMDTRVNVMASNYMIGLSSWHCSATWDTEQHTMRCANSHTAAAESRRQLATKTPFGSERGELAVRYTPSTEQYTAAHELAAFGALRDMMASAWVGRSSSRNCHLYDWERTQVRPCAVALDCGSDVFMADDTLLRAGSYASEPLSDANPWGAVEVRAPFRLGTPRD